MKIESKYNIGDNLYKWNCRDNYCQSFNVWSIRIFDDRIEYYGGVEGHAELIDENALFNTKEECERNFVLKKFGHLFKDTKTLK